MITRKVIQFFQLCITFFIGFLHFITFNYFKIDESLTRTSPELAEVDEFPFLRLPLLVREHVLCMMTPFELINLSMTSSKARRVVIFFSRIKSRFWVVIELYETPYIDIKGKKGTGKTWEYSWTSDPSMVGQSTNSFFDEITHKFSESKMEDCMKWYEIIKPVLGCRIDKVCADNLNTSITDWLRSQQDLIKGILIQQGCQEDVKYLLKSIRVTGSLELTIKRDHGNFRLDIPEGLTHFEVFNSEFINYDQLLKLKIRNIALNWSNLTNHEINRFLKSWMACESHLELESFQVNVSEPTEEIIDLPHEETTDLDAIFEQFPYPTEATSGYKIQRSDGKVATVCFSQWNDLYLLVH